MSDAGSPRIGQRETCPHPNVMHCPLYVVSHAADLHGCIWGEFVNGCAVERGDIDYDREIARLAETLDGACVISDCIRAEREAEDKAQRERNRRAAGLR